MFILFSLTLSLIVVVFVCSFPIDLARYNAHTLSISIICSLSKIIQKHIEYVAEHIIACFQNKNQKRRNKKKSSEEKIYQDTDIQNRKTKAKCICRNKKRITQNNKKTTSGQEDNGETEGRGEKEK